LRLQVLGALEERGVRVRDALLLVPVARHEPGRGGRHHGDEESDDRERDHADAVLPETPPGERPEAGRFLLVSLDPRLRGDDHIACGHLKLTLGSTNLYITSTSRLTIMVMTAR